MATSYAHPSASPALGLAAVPAVMPARYLTNNEAAAYVRLSPRTLEKLRVQGGGPRFRKFGRRVLYAIADLDAWADGHSYAMTSDPEYLEHRSCR